MQKISVCMTTCNGSRYIEKQLESIYTQTLKPDEVIIRDDCSSDETAEILESFIHAHGLEGSWDFTVNDHNLGWQRNFFETVKASTGDIIFFADQDDIWLPDKIEIMSDVMRRCKAGCVCGGFIRINENGKVLRDRRKKQIRLINDGKQQADIDGLCSIVPLDKQFNNFVHIGCCMCIDREIAGRYLKLGVSDFGHDMQCGRLAILYSRLVRIDRPVIKYRVHGNNTSGADAKLVQGGGTLKLRCTEIAGDIKWLSKLMEAEDESAEAQKHRKLFSELIKFQKVRYRYLAKKKGSWLKLWEYTELYSGVSMLIGDFAYRHGMNRVLGRLARVVI